MKYQIPVIKWREDDKEHAEDSLQEMLTANLSIEPSCIEGE